MEEEMLAEIDWLRAMRGKVARSKNHKQALALAFAREEQLLKKLPPNKRSLDPALVEHRKRLEAEESLA